MGCRVLVLVLLVCAATAEQHFDPVIEAYAGPDLLETNQEIKQEFAGSQGIYAEQDCPLIGNDTIIPSNIANEIKNSMRKRKKRTMYHYGNFPENKWPNNIGFTISSAFTPVQSQIIRDNLKLFEDNTCVRFTPRLDGDPALESNPYISFTKGSGCISFVSKGQNDSPQKLFLADQCFFNNAGTGRGGGDVARTIGRALGLWDETSRSDRDDHVTINFANVQENEAGNFIKLTDQFVETFGNPFDYGSTVHFPSTAFASVNTANAITVQPSLPHYEQTIGQRVKPSFWDFKKINFAYCNGSCSFPLSCANQGYQDPNDCSRCICPDGFAGTLCDQRPLSIGGICGQHHVLSRWGTPLQITSPNYPSDYGLYKECTWWLRTSEPGQRIRLWFDGQFDVFCRKGVAYHWVEIRYLQGNGQDGKQVLTGPRFCGQQRPHVDIISETDQVMVLFRSNYDNNNDLDQQNPTPGNRKGFKLFAEVLNCGGCGIKPGQVHMACQHRIETETVTTTCCGYREQRVCRGWWIFRTCRDEQVAYYYTCTEEQPVKFCCDGADLCTSSYGQSRCTKSGWGDWSNCYSCRRCNRQQYQWRCSYEYNRYCQPYAVEWDSRPCS